MPTNNNTAVSEKIRDGLKINQSTENVPTRVAESIVPVFEVSPEKKIKNHKAIVSNTASGNLITFNGTKRTFMIGLELTTTKDAVNDAVNATLTGTLKANGSAKVMLELRFEPTTAGSQHVSMVFPFPVELEKGSVLAITHSLGTAEISSSGIVYYYEED